MEQETRSRAHAGTFFNVLERLILFALSVAVGLVNLLIALAVAAHMGVLPKETSGQILRITSCATAPLTRAMAPPAPPAPKHKKPKP